MYKSRHNCAGIWLQFECYAASFACQKRTVDYTVRAVAMFAQRSYNCGRNVDSRTRDFRIQPDRMQTEPLSFRYTPFTIFGRLS